MTQDCIITDFMHVKTWITYPDAEIISSSDKQMSSEVVHLLKTGSVV